MGQLSRHPIASTMWILKICVPLVLLVALVAADGGHRHSHRSGRRGRQRSRGGRQDSSVADTEPVQGGVDFSDCETQDDGMCCVMREEEITTLKKDPILECTHKSVEKCHYTYVTEFSPVQEEVCEENFEKKCQITFKRMAVTETVKKMLPTTDENLRKRSQPFQTSSQTTASGIWRCQRFW